MPVLLFWNVKRGAALPYLQRACVENAVDIAILAEDTTKPGTTEAALNLGGLHTFTEYAPVPSQVRIYSKSSVSLGLSADVEGRVAIRSYNPPGGTPILIVAAHIPSKFYANEDDQHYYSRKIRLAIEDAERRAGHQNSIIIGDFNMNPFEKGMVAADGLHGVMDKFTASGRPRSYYGDVWTYFYNPMFSRLGDESMGPSGTYFGYSGGIVRMYWHTLDQVLIRPALIPFFRNDNIKVLTEIGDIQLLRNNRIADTISDHLPLVARFDIE